MTFNNAILTIKGNNLLVGTVLGKEIEFIRLETGNGLYDGTERLPYMNGLKNKQQEFPFLRYEKVSEKSAILVVMISNENLSEGYRITEIGIYGKLKDSDEEVLCSIATIDPDEADFWPPFNGVSPTKMLLRYHVTISPDAKPSIVVDDHMVLAEIAAESNRAQKAELLLAEQLSGLKENVETIDDTIEELRISVDTKVNVEDGKGLSTEDFSTEEKKKLKDISEGAEANVQSDWEETDTKSDAFIKNKPAIPDGVTITNNYLATVPGTAADAVLAKELRDDLNELSKNLRQDFQAGVDVLYNKCVSCGATPSAKTPAAISTAIGTIHTNRYNSGYSAGRTQGRNDVIANPGVYGLAMYKGDVQQSFYPSTNGDSYYTIISPSADVSYSLTASTLGGYIYLDSKMVDSVSAGSSAHNTVSGSFTAKKGQIIKFKSQNGTYVKINEHFG